MADVPPPLKLGTLLADRFEVELVLGRGAFGIAYVATDLSRNDRVVVKELAPSGTHRDSEGRLQLPGESAHRLRQAFLEEAKLVSRLHVRGILPLRMGFVDNGTAYFATDYLPNAQTLENILRVEGRMDVDGALDIVFQILDILESIHEKHVLHRDLKPSNILLTPNGEVSLIDFGAAREWHHDSVSTQTILFTPDYAPLEQMTERARRGPATDLFSLSAVTYEMLAGRRPESATERASGKELTALRTIRPDVPEAVAKAIERGLALKLNDRPHSAREFRDMFAGETEVESRTSLFALDAQMVRLQKFSYERKECPSCHGLLEDPKPLRNGICPVCRDGVIKQREIHAHRCPVCTNAIMKRFKNHDPMLTCPDCVTGWLEIARPRLLSKSLKGHCPNCDRDFDASQLSSDANQDSTRSPYLWRCPDCTSQFDERPDGRLKLAFSPTKIKFQCLYPEEWDCVAAGLEPGAGNSECLGCSADYYVDRDGITLLVCHEDPYGFARENLGRRLTVEEYRWAAVGKSSPNEGLTCSSCGTEFDKEGDYLRLVRSSNRRFQGMVEMVNKLVDWHRIARDLPTIAEEIPFSHRIIDEIIRAYEEGEIGFDDSNELLWKGAATNLDTNSNGTLIITKSEFQFGGVFRKLKIPIDAFIRAEANEGTLIISVKGEPEPLTLSVTQIDLTIFLESGRYTVELGPEQLASRLNFELSRVSVP